MQAPNNRNVGNNYNTLVNNSNNKTALPAKKKVLRESQIQNAVGFLANETMQETPLTRKIKFLESKGLNTDEIEEALRRSNEANLKTSSHSPLKTILITVFLTITSLGGISLLYRLLRNYLSRKAIENKTNNDNNIQIINETDSSSEINTNEENNTSNELNNVKSKVVFEEKDEDDINFEANNEEQYKQNNVRYSYSDYFNNSSNNLFQSNSNPSLNSNNNSASYSYSYKNEYNTSNIRQENQPLSRSNSKIEIDINELKNAIGQLKNSLKDLKENDLIPNSNIPSPANPQYSNNNNDPQRKRFAIQRSPMNFNNNNNNNNNNSGHWI